MEKKWITTKGDALRIEDMADSHVRNALRLMIRRFGNEEQGEEVVFDMSNEVARSALKSMISTYGNARDWIEDHVHTEDQFSIY